MALIKCSECNNELSDKAKSCPHCGCPIEEILINKISNQRLKDLLKNQSIIFDRVNKNKKDFLLQNNLCDEIYVPIIINAEGYSSDDIKKENIIKFKKMASEDKLHVGDIVNVKRGDGQMVAVTISKITYSEDSFDKTTFPNAKYSTEFNLQRHYKKIPIELSDDDYEIASEYSNHINNSNHNLVNNIAKTTNNFKNNFNSDAENTSVGFICNVLSLGGIFVYIIGFFVGLFLGIEEEIWEIAFSIWAVAFLFGTFMLGFSDMINLLNNINNKL